MTNIKLLKKNQRANLISNFLKLGFSNFIIEIYIKIAINFINNVKIRLKLLKSRNLIKSLLPSFFFFKLIV